MCKRCVVLFLMLFSADLASADPFVVAAFDTPPFESSTCCFGGAYRQQFSQSFITTADGVITRVDIPLWAAAPRIGDITLSLHKAEVGIPVGPALTTSHVGADAVPPSCCSADPPFVSFLMPGLSVRQGDMLAMVLDGTSQAQWASASGVYAGGFLSRRSYGNLDWDRIGDSVGFRVLAEAEAPSPVPEPATMLLLSSGLVALICRRGAVRHSHVDPGRPGVRYREVDLAHSARAQPR